MKTSQISIYVIAGLLLVILVGSAYYYSIRLNNSELSGEGNFPPVTQDFLSKTIDDCIHDSLIDAINLYGICNTENKIKEELMVSLPKCIDFTRFREQKYEVIANAKPDSVDAEIKSDEIYVKLTYPIEMKKEGENIKFTDRQYVLPRTTSMKLEYDSESRTTKDNILVSSDTDAELAVFRGTKVSAGTKTVPNISVYMKEICPDDPSVVGKVKYIFSPENIKFTPDAFLTIRYEDNDVSKMSREERFKIAYLEGNHWEPVVSSANIERDRVRTSVDHLSEWTASCDLTNKYGSQIMLQDLFAQDPGAADSFIEKDVACAANFSGNCGYAKIVVYTKIDNFLEIYTKALNEMYEQHLIPVITIKETPPKQNWETIWYYKHPGLCETTLDCKYGENEDGSGKPGYDYNGDIAYTVALLDAVHKDKPQWPIYVELWEEPNLASQWGDISLTDYQVQQYVRFFREVAEAVDALPHAESIKIMQGGLAPTEGMKRCMLTPRFDKQYDAAADSDPITETYAKGNQAYLTVGGCKAMKYMPDYMQGNQNYCEPIIPQSPGGEICPSVGSCIGGCCTPTNPACTGHPATQADLDACCNPQHNYISSINGLRQYYSGKVGDVLFGGYDEADEDADCESDDILVAMGNAEAIADRIHDTINDYCFEKVTEINTNEYLNKIFAGGSNSALCQYIDVYADHSYPDNTDMETFPGGQDPFGMDAYKARFNLVKGKCGELSKFNCIDANNKDTDNDGIKDINDNCPYVTNTDQTDWDGDGYGDVCDNSDKDADNTPDSTDKCPLDPDVQAGEDTDADGWANSCDNCPEAANHNQADLDLDTLGDACDDNTDNDGMPDIGFDRMCVVNTQNTILTECVDNCRYISNGPELGSCLGEPDKTCTNNGECTSNKCQKNQEDEDGDGYGDLCDNCVNYPNPTQGDFNKDSIGDACQDSDGDGFKDNIDFCPTTSSPENTPVICAADSLCQGKVFITETAWAPHIDIYELNLEHEFDFNVNDYITQMQQAYSVWEGDDNVIAAIPFHLGEGDGVYRKELSNYSWTEKICTDQCVGKEIFNVIGKIQNPVTECTGGSVIPGGECTNSKLIYQNLKAEVGAKTHQYTCMKCNEQGTLNPPGSSSMSVSLANGMTVKFVGMDECFEKKDIEIPAGAGGCPEVIGSDTNDGYIPHELTVDGKKYYGWAVCVPDAPLQSSKAWFHACGTEQDCNYNSENCLTSGGTYGNWWVSCVPNGDGTCASDSDCTGGLKCEPTKKKCVECITDSHCTDAAKPVCDSSTDTCIAGCTDNTDCTDAAKPVCDTTSKQCVSCIADADCTDTARPVCDIGSALCVECTTDADCTDAVKTVCDTTLKICEEPTE